MKAFIIELMMPKYIWHWFVLLPLVVDVERESVGKKPSSFFDARFRNWNEHKITIQLNWQYHRFMCASLSFSPLDFSFLFSLNEKKINQSCQAWASGGWDSVYATKNYVHSMFEHRLQIQQNGKQLPIMKIIVFIYFSSFSASRSVFTIIQHWSTSSS